MRKDLGEKSPEEIYGFTEEEMEILEKIFPYCEYGFHTIESIKYIPYTESIVLL